MNALAFERICPTRDMPWFEDYAKHNTFCKVYNDGGCYIAVPSSTGLKKHKQRSYIRSSKDDLFDDIDKIFKRGNARRDSFDF